MATNLRARERIDYSEFSENDDVTRTRGKSVVKPKAGNKDMSENIDHITSKQVIQSEGTIMDTSHDTFEDATPSHQHDIPQDITPLEIDIMVAIEDIDDLIDENPMFDDITTAKLEDHRTNLRRLRLTLMKASPRSEYLSKIKTTLDMKIKSYIRSNKSVNDTTKIKQEQIMQDKVKQIQRSTEFLVNNIQRDLCELTEEFSKQTDTATDEEITKWKKDIPHLSSKVDKVADNIKTLMQTRSSDASYDTSLKNIKEQFETLFTLKKSFVSEIDEELTIRDIEKNREFNRSRLNIKLEKFSGYDSKIDFFTFRSNFEKIYIKTTPRHFLSELLKNNFLSDHALNLVRNLDDIDIIWERLKDVYGNPKMMLSKRLLQLSTLDISKSTKPEKAIDSLTKVINVLQDLMRLAQEHDIEEYLYYGEGLNTVYQLIGDVQTTKFLDTICNEDLKQHEIWSKLISFLDHQKRIHQQRLLIQGPSISDPAKRDASKKDSSYRRGSSAHYTGPQGANRPPDQLNCFICQATNHVATNGPQGSKIVQYFACPIFVNMTPIERFNALKSKGLCFQCLYPGAKYDQGKHKEGRCQKIFCCKDKFHDNYTHKKHVLVCDEHKSTQENKDLFDFYKSRCITKIQQLENFSKDMRLTYLTKVDEIETEPTDEHQAIYILQSIKINEKQFNLFYDNGCKNAVIKFDATKRLGNKRSKQIISRPIPIGGVGGVTTQSSHGIYTFTLPLANNKDVEMTGACLDTLTATFPLYPLQGEVENDIKHDWEETGHDINQLPRLPPFVGGDTDIMIGIRYLRLFPKFIHQLPSGLTIYQSQFKNVDGTYGVIGGPHEVFTYIENQHHSASSQFVASQLQAAKFGFYVDPDVRLLGPASHSEIRHDLHLINDLSSETNNDEYHLSTSYHIRLHEQFESVGTNLNYRCINCRNCSTCKNHSTEDSMSIQEEVEQDLINRSISIDPSKCTTTASLPLIDNPSIKLSPNRDIALRVYIQQLKRLEKHPNDKNDIIISEKKLQHLGFVEYVKNLPEPIQKQLSTSQINNFIPWRAVWKGSSVSTPCRIVFDASMPTSSGFSLNDVLAKGRNSMNKLLEIFLRWRGHRIAFHTDIQKMYNSVKLRESDWCLQRYLWQEHLDPNQPPEEKVIMTLIYGVKSSGNQAETALRETVKIYREEQPEVARVVTEDVYVDDCLSGGDQINAIKILCQSIEQILSYGGFTLKGITISGDDPKESLSADGTTISVAGMKWHPKNDLISYDINLDFAKKYRGKRIGECQKVPKRLTRRICASKSAEIFDMTGLLTPITATFKLDIHDLVQRKMSWDDELPANLRDVWINHFNLMEEIKTITYQRTIVPIEATSLKIDTLDFADASPSMICSAIYIRFPIPDGFSCQLIFARSKLLPENTTQPRGELAAAVLNAHTGEVIRKAFKQDHTAYKFTDSQITLHWICNESRPLKQWVRNRVVEVLRFTKKDSWKYIKSADMIADLGTRRNTSLDLIKPGSLWFTGHPWMKTDPTSFPAWSSKDISLDQSQLQRASQEVRAEQVHHNSTNQDQIRRRYVFSSYIIDPNKHRFSTVIRILALVFKFIKNTLSSVRQSISTRTRSNYVNTPKALVISDTHLQQAEEYFYRKGTSEVKEFIPLSKYAKSSHEIDGILKYTGRILPTDSVTIIGQATQRMLDLKSTSFCVPILEKSSPIAYSIVNDIHWNHPTVSHSGVETTWRYVLQKVFIIEGRSLVKSIRSTCERCRYLLKKTIDVSMGPVSPDNLMIAPIFYVSQVDLCGPFQSYSYHNRRATIKIWYVVFCCATTTTINIKCMEDYSSSAFLQAFTRFSCEVGYPRRLLTDEGSQLVKACETLQFDFQDIQHRLFKESNVEFDICPVGGHNMNGLVERKIREVKKSIEKSVTNQRLSIMQWETFASRASNSINDLPLGIRDYDGDLQSLDIITPNRLKLGRNNDRSPSGAFKLSNDSSKLIQQNQNIFDSWFELWLTSHVPGLITKPKWFKSDTNLTKGDVVLFTKQSSPLRSHYQFGMVESVEFGRDNKVRKVQVRYLNASEDSHRYTHRSARSLVVIHRVDETSIMVDLYNASKLATCPGAV